ncbi:MAG: hypothetical protein ACOYUB_04465 [Patescibacteria group bacterium]
MNLFLPAFTVYAQVKEWTDPSLGGPTGCVIDGVPTLKCLEVVFGNILFMSSAFIVLTLFIMFIVGSFNYLTSFGNAEKVKKAQGTLRLALVGFIIFIGAFLILKIIDILFLGNTGAIFKFEIGGP